MKLNYYLKSISVVVSAIAMLIGSASLTQAESLASKQSEDSAIATTHVNHQINHKTDNQAQNSASTRAADLLTVNDSNLAASELEQAPSITTEYSLTPIPAAEQLTLDNANSTAPTNETLLSGADVEQRGTQTTIQADADENTFDNQTLYDERLENDAFRTESDPVNSNTAQTAPIDSNMAQTDTLELDMNGMTDSSTASAAENENQFVFENGASPEISDTSEDGMNEGAETVAQVITPGRATRSGASYIGVGGNIGLGDGETALGEGSFAAFSKIGLTRNISVRPSILINDNPTILLPVTFDFIPGVTQVTENVSEEVGLRISPFVGAGAAISTGDDGSVDFLATAGVDIPLGRRFTGVAAVNASLFDNPAVGLLLGVGINFPALR